MLLVMSQTSTQQPARSSARCTPRVIGLVAVPGSVYVRSASAEVQ